MNPQQQIKAMKLALMRVGEFHSKEGAIARLTLMEVTGTHPWDDARSKGNYAKDGHLWIGEDIRIGDTQRFDELRDQLHKHGIHVNANGVLMKWENNNLNMGRSIELIVGRLLCKLFSWKFVE